MSVSDIQDTPRASVETRLNGDGSTAVKTGAARAKQALKTGAQRGAEIARTQAAVAGRKVSEIAQERPLTSVSTALGAGLAVGFLAGVCAGRSMASSWPRNR
jgi:ElaB/YqjD/DUF883 family membrane-anchored ribosome-binding protein